MKRILSFLFTFVLLTAILTITVNADGGLPFTDVKDTAWYYDEVEAAYNAGIMKGKTDTIFDPTATMTRAEFVMVLSRLSGEECDGMGEYLSFADIKTDAWYSDAVAWGVTGGLVKGLPENKFAPASPVTRQEMAVFIIRLADYMNVSLPDDAETADFKDEGDVATFAASSVELMRLSGIIKGDDTGRFNPTANTSRAEVATVVTRLLRILPNNGDAEVDLPYTYSIYLPEGYDSSREYPLLVYMTTNNFSGVNICFESEVSPAHESIVVVPHIPGIDNWGPSDSRELLSIIDLAVKDYNIDESRQYITAVGKGCWVAWKTAVYDSARFAGVLFVHGPVVDLYSTIIDGEHTMIVNPEHISEGMKDIPIYLVHDRNDYIEEIQNYMIDPDYGRQLYTALTNYGHTNVHLLETTEFGGDIVNHFVSVDDTSLLEWLFEQSR